jgi:hypothetical protein
MLRQHCCHTAAAAAAVTAERGVAGLSGSAQRPWGCEETRERLGAGERNRNKKCKAAMDAFKLVKQLARYADFATAAITPRARDIHLIISADRPRAPKPQPPAGTSVWL